MFGINLYQAKHLITIKPKIQNKQRFDNLLNKRSFAKINIKQLAYFS